MGSTFNPQILMEKLAKLNSSQQSIETLSHWCIFHMNKAKQVVETWGRQFHSSPREQRLAFLYLANDILQNSRRKGSEFVGEFWKVLPGAIRDVIENEDESGRNAAKRLISIWEERKVFGSRGQILKEELMGNNSNKNGKPSEVKVKHVDGNALDKIVSSFQVVYGGQLDEDAILSKCRNAISCVEKVDKEIGGDFRSGKPKGSGIAEELKGQQDILRDCVEHLTAVESSRESLVSHLREALQEQEFKLDEVRNQLQAAQSQFQQADSFCRQLLNCDSMEESHSTKAPQSFISGNSEQLAPLMYTRQVSFAEKSGHIGEDPKSAAAAVAAKLTASTSSAQMLSYVFSSLASEGIIGNSVKEYSSEKRVKLDDDHSSYIPLQNHPPPPVPPFPHHDEQPPPPSSPPPLPPVPPLVQPYQMSQFMQSVPYSYSPIQQQTPLLPGYHFTSPTLNSYQNYQTEMAPIPRQ